MSAAPPSGRRIAPSILSADFARLGAQVGEVMAAGARVIHVDVMDGHFVPPITMGALAVAALREQVDAEGGFIDVHLMVERPELHVADFARAGADGVTLHPEATPHVHRALGLAREAGCRAGLALNPGSPTDLATPLSDVLDLALCMSVNPGWGGQPFLARSPERLRRLRALLPEPVVLEVDGGVDERTGPRCAEAGATWLVAGSSVFGAPDPGEAYRRLAAAVGAE